MPRLVIASNNPGKLREFAALLAPLGFDLVAQGALGIGEAEEPYPTFVENALAKARHASAASGLVALADDSGLCVPALGGLPGVWSARFAGSRDDGSAASSVDANAGSDRLTQDSRNNDKLVAALADAVGAARDAYYVCCLVLMRAADDAEPVVAVGRWAGRIVAAARGANGFGYDPHFLLPALGVTAAELAPATKNGISHRGIALRSLVEQWQAREAWPDRSR